MIEAINAANNTTPVTATDTSSHISTDNNASKSRRPGKSSSTSGTGNVNSSHNANSPQVAEEIAAYEDAQLLAQMGASTQNTTAAQQDASVLDGILLNLSPQALNILNGIGATVDASGSVTFTGILGVHLTVQQQQQFASIVAQYANAPFNENTFVQMQASLTAAGIDPNQVSMQEVLQGLLSVPAPFNSVDSELVTSEMDSEVLSA